MNNWEFINSLRGELGTEQYLATCVPLGAAYFISQYRKEVCDSLTYQWTQLLTVEEDLDSKLTEHFKEIEAAEPLLKDTFSLLWANVKVSSVKLKKIMLWIHNNVKKEKIGSWIRDLIQDISELMGMKAGCPTTLDSLSCLIGGLVSNGETLYDGTCGFTI